jgi:tRNA acetyltransferase TAN1
MIHYFRRSTFLVTCPSSWERQAVHELTALLPDSTCRVLFLPGNLLMNSEQPRADVLRVLEEAETRFIGHVIPAVLRVDITKERESLELLLKGALQLPPLDPQFTFRVSCNRRGNHEFDSREAEYQIGDRLADEWGLQADLDEPEQFVSVEVFQDLAFLDACFADERLHKDIGQMRKHAPGQRPLNRAEKKLREAFTRFRIKLPVGARALDLGSAPGGWARVLAEVCAEVVAVDPAEMDERVTALPNVTHVQVRADQYLPQARGPFDLITCDMNAESPVSAELLCQAAPLLRERGEAILTIKFTSRQRRLHVRRALDVLEACYTDFDTKHLPHNGKETTLHMRKRQP